jgi:hypothetical protein
MRLQKEFEDAQGVIKSVNRRTDNAMVKRKMTKGQTTTYKALHIKLRID